MNIKPYQTFFLRMVREGTSQLWRNKFLSLSAIGLGVLILFLLNFVFGIRYFIDQSLQNLEARSDFSIPLEESYDSFEFDALKNELKEFDVTPTLLPAEQFADFSLPARINISFQDLEQVSPVLAVFKKARYTEVVGDWDSQSERSFASVADRLVKLKKTTNGIAQTLVIIFIIGGILLAMNTFQLILFSRREEVFIARLVGAHNKFIMAPFLFEGFLLGFLSALLAMVVFVIVLRQVTILPGGDIFVYLFTEVFTLELLIAAGVGTLGAFFSTRRYLLSQFE